MYHGMIVFIFVLLIYIRKGKSQKTYVLASTIYEKIPFQVLQFYERKIKV